MLRVLLGVGLLLFSVILRADDSNDCPPHLRALRGPALTETAETVAIRYAREYAEIIAFLRNPSPAIQAKLRLDMDRFRIALQSSKEYERLGDLIFVPWLRIALESDSADMRAAAIELYRILGPTSEFALEHLQQTLREILEEFRTDVGRLLEPVDFLPAPDLPEPKSTLVALLHLLPTLDNRSEESMDIMREFLEILFQVRGSGSPANSDPKFNLLVSEMESALIGGLLSLQIDEAVEYLAITIPLLHQSEATSLASKRLPVATYYATLIATYARFCEPAQTQRLFDVMEDHYRIASNNYRHHGYSPTVHWRTLNTLGAALIRTGGSMHALFHASENLFRSRRWTSREFWEAAHYIEAVRMADVDLDEKPTAHQLVFNAVKRFALELPQNPGDNELKALDILLQSLQRYPQSRKPEALKHLFKELTQREDLPAYIHYHANRVIHGGG